MENLAPMLMLMVFFIAIAVVIISLSNNRLKKKMLELGHVDENAIKLFSKSMQFKFDALKWGLVLFFAGLGLVIIAVLPVKYLYDSTLPFGIELMFIAVGFLVYFFLVKSRNEETSDYK